MKCLKKNIMKRDEPFFFRLIKIFRNHNCLQLYYLYKYHFNTRDLKYFNGELLELYRAYKLGIK